jgi:4-azaleucine resistance transporter AzlC
METANSAPAPSELTMRPLAWLRASREGLPIMLGYLPVGFAFGVLAQKVGLDLAGTLLMSVIVYAGSAQLIGVGLIGAGLSPVSIIVTTFIVNLRHLLMSAALSPHLRSWRAGRIALFAFELTDETFALHSQRFSREEPDTPQRVRDTLLINGTVHAAWVLGSWLGFSAGTLIPDVKPVGLDYALPAMFITLLVGQVKSRLHFFVALLAGGLSVALLFLGFDQFNVIVATVATAALGALLETRRGGAAPGAAPGEAPGEAPAKPHSSEGDAR